MSTGNLIETYRNEAGAFGTYHGAELATHFSSPEREFDAAFLRAALIDHSFAGRIEVRGADGLDFLHRLSTNDLLQLPEGGVAGTVLTNEKGRVIDYLTVALLADRILLIASPESAGLVLSWLDKYHITEDLQLTDVTPDTAMISLIGPEANSTASSALGIQLRQNKAVEVEWKGGRMTVIGAETSRLPIVHIVGSAESLAGAWKAMVSPGEGAIPMGFEAFEAYRISRGVAMPGGEITTAYNPYEVGLREAISFTKGCYIGQEVIARLDTYDKVQRTLVGLVSKSPIARGSDQARLFRDGAEVGLVTSLTNRAFHGRYIGLGVVASDSVHEGDGLEARSSGRTSNVISLHLPILVQGASVA